jgi:hypothetical protein
MVPAAAASNGGASLHAATASGPANHFEIAVADPVKQGEGVSAYVSYKVRKPACQFAGADRWCLLRTAVVWVAWQLKCL